MVTARVKKERWRLGEMMYDLPCRKC